MVDKDIATKQAVLCMGYLLNNNAVGFKVLTQLNLRQSSGRRNQKRAFTKVTVLVLIKTLNLIVQPF